MQGHRLAFIEWVSVSIYRYFITYQTPNGFTLLCIISLAAAIMLPDFTREESPPRPPSNRFFSPQPEVFPLHSPQGESGATWARISSLDAVRAATPATTMRRSWRASVLRGRPGPGLRLWECSIDHCWKVCDTPPVQCAQHVQQSVDMFIQLPKGLQCHPVQMAEVVQK